MSRRVSPAARLAAAQAALVEARTEQARLEAALAERSRALAVVDSLPTFVRAATPAQKHADEVMGDLSAINSQILVARQQVFVYERKVEEASRYWVRTGGIYPPLGNAERNAAVHSVESAPSAVERATKWLQIVELFVSPRVAREEIGDLLEIIHKYAAEGRPRWHVYVRAITGAVLATWHTWGDKLASLKKIGG
jgi:hypothetical protein